ncbi:hypothetical protein HKD37_12G034872 [Glycine soja]
MASKGLKIKLLGHISSILDHCCHCDCDLEPNIIVHPVGLENFALLTNVTGNVSLGMLITIENPNYENFEYPNATGYVKFLDTVVGQVPIVGELVPPRSQINVNTSANFMVSKLINDPNFLSDFLSGIVNFTSTASLPGKAHMLKIIKFKATVYSLSGNFLTIQSVLNHSIKVYEYIRGVKPTVSWCSVIWNSAISPKMFFILWLAKRNRLLTLDKVVFLNKGSLCPLCSNELESNVHLFFSCRKSLQVWAHIRDLAPFDRRFTSLQRITDSLIRSRSTSGVQVKLRCLAIAITAFGCLVFKIINFL